MEVISFHMDIVSRRTGRSAVQMAAYCSRDKLYSNYTGKTYDYTKRHDLIYHEVIIPDFAPDAFHRSEILWNDVEKVEKCRNSRLARVLTIALPRELSHDSQIAMVRQYVEQFFVRHGMCADVSLHDKGDGNGNRIRDPITHQYRLGKSIKTNDWDAPERIEKWRSEWAQTCNLWFRKCGISKKITHKSYARQGIDREATIHLGAKVKALEERGLLTDRGRINRDIAKRNHDNELQRLRQKIERNHNYELERNWLM